MLTIELPYETFERIFHRKWPGGGAPLIRELLKFYGIPFKPRSVAANSALQDYLLGIID